MPDSTQSEQSAPLRSAFRFVALAFAMSWLIWLPGTREKWATEYLIFGSAGPALAAIFLSRRSLMPGSDVFRRMTVFIAVLFAGWVILLMSSQWRAGTIQPLKWNAWLLLPAMMPALVCRAAAGGGSVEGRWLRSLVVSTGWKWPLIALFVWPAFLLIPAALFHLAGGRLVIPGRATGAYVATSVVMFAKQFLFAALLEEPGWRGYLLPRFEERFSPLLASMFVWLPWALWHAPLDFTGGVGSTWGNYLQIRVLYFIVITILMTWLYNRSGRSLLTVALFHASFNTFPFVLPYAPPMLALIFPITIGLILSDKMWKQIGFVAAPSSVKDA